MEFGKRLKEARLAAGLSQRQLCGEEITRNMLSQIENGYAMPSLATLSYLSSRLGKPVSFFLQEDAITSPNPEVMERARESLRNQDPEGGRRALEAYRGPDPVFDEEYRLIFARIHLNLGEQALLDGRKPYALELLRKAEETGKGSLYWGPEEERRLWLVRMAVDPGQFPMAEKNLPSLDRELTVRAEAALAAGDLAECRVKLEAVDNREDPGWNFLRGEVWFREEKWAEAAACYHRAEKSDPYRTAPRLERCYREMEDYKQAYFYACRQKNNG